jgi:hypothetical protein
VKNIRFATQDQFVDREAEIARLLYFNFKSNRAAFNGSNNLRHHNLCIVTQFLGAGKTSFLRNYAPRLTNPTSAAAIAKAYEDLFCAGEKQNAARTESKIVLAATAGMRATIVDCKSTMDETLLALANELASTWQFSLANCALERPFQKFEIALERARTLGPVFIGLDEVFNLGAQLTSVSFGKAMQEDYAGQLSALAKWVEASSVEELAKCYKACDVYHTLQSQLLGVLQTTAIDRATQMPRHEVHFGVAGRVPMLFLHLINEESVGAPYTNIRVLLQPLSQDAMREVVLNPGYQLHGLTPESIEALVSELRSMSVGLPRYVHYALAEIGGGAGRQYARGGTAGGA